MKNRVWRPLNTVGLVFIGSVVSFTMIYTVLDLSRVCSAI